MVRWRVHKTRSLALLVFAALAWAHASWAWPPTPPPAHPYHFVLDIDNVVAYRIPKSEAGKVDLTGKTTLEQGDQIYVIYDDSASLLQDLIDIPGAKVSFQSFGQKERNDPLLAKLKLPRGHDGKTTAKEIATKVLSWNDSTWVNRKKEPDEYKRLNPDERFFQAEKKKDLLKIVSPEELPYTILLDDTPKNVMRGQEGSFLLVDRTWKEKAPRIREVLEQLFSEMRKTGKPPNQLLYDLQFERRGDTLVYRHDNRLLWTAPPPKPVLTEADLKTMLESHDPAVFQSAAQELHQLDKPNASLIKIVTRRMKDDGDPEIRRRALGFTLEVSSKDELLWPLVLERVNDPSPIVRETLASRLKGVHHLSRMILEVLNRLKLDPEPSVATAANASLQTLAPRTSAEVAEIEKALSATQDWEKLSEQIQGEIGPGYAQRFRVLQIRPDGTLGESLPTTPVQYQKSKIVTSSTPPNELPEGARVVQNVAFGYRAKNNFRRISPLNYVVLSKDGQVLEVGCPSPEAEGEFKNFVYRKNRTPTELSKIEKLNRELFEYLRSDPRSKEKLAAFAKDRGWPPGYVDEMQLAYYSSKLTPIEPWAKAHGYTLDDLRDAGWVDRTFDRYGRPIYSMTPSDSVKIPFFADPDKTRLVRFRSRLVGRIDPKVNKYMSSVPDRSLDDDLVTDHRLYNSELLPQAKGKTVVITEGEFKSFVATRSTGTLTVGMTGISDYDPAIIRQLVDAGASHYVVLFDYDPPKPGAIGPRESQRTAYQLAETLKAAGAPDVKVAVLPGGGKKMGVDDMILERGPTQGPVDFEKVIASAKTPEEYARSLGLIPHLEEILLRRQTLARMVRRAGHEKSSAVQNATDLMTDLDPLYQRHFSAQFPDIPNEFAPAVERPAAEVPQTFLDGKPLPPLHDTPPQDWAIAERAPVNAALQITERPNLFGRGQDLLSDVLHQLPKHFPKLPLDRMQQDLGFAILDLPQLKLDEARRLTEILRNLTPEEIQHANLNRPVTVADADHIEVVSRLRAGVQRIGIKPHPEFLAWRERLVDLIAKHDPELVRTLRSRSDSMNPEIIEFVDWVNLKGEPLPEAELPEARASLAKAFERARASEISPPNSLVIDLKRQPIDIASQDAGANKAVLFSFRADESGKLKPGPISRWTSKQLNPVGHPYERTVEFYTHLLGTDTNPTNPRIERANQVWKAEPMVANGRMNISDFEAELSPELKGLVRQELPGVSSSNLPSIYIDPKGGEPIYHRAVTQNSFAPDKAVSFAPVIEDIKIPSNGRIFGGYAIYGSSTHRDMSYPVDVDVLYNGIVKVPDSIATREEAVEYARRVYLQEVLGHFAKLARDKKIEISEVMIGSNATMKQKTGNLSPADDFKSAPFLTQEDFLKGQYRDAKGNLWSLEDLVALDDFTKMKFDLYHDVNGKSVTQKMSMQFLPAFEWKGEVHFMRSGALKGFPNSPVATAGYYGADSYAAGMMLERVMKQTAAQSGPSEVLSVRELLIKGWKHYEKPVGYLDSEAQLSTKFLKEYLRKTNFYMIQDPAFETAIFADTKRFMQKKGTWDPKIDLARISREILASINTPEVDALNRLKSVVTDLEEFNERNQTMSLRFWEDRKAELLGTGPNDPGIIQKVETAIRDGKIKTTPSFMNALKKVKEIVTAAAAQAKHPDHIAHLIVESGLPEDEKIHGKAFSTLTKEISALQNIIHTSPDQAHSLSPSVIEFIRTSTALSPHTSSRFVRARQNLSDKDLALRYRLMGIDATPENLARMKKFDEIFDTASPEELQALQKEILTHVPAKLPLRSPAVDPCQGSWERIEAAALQH